MVYYALKTTEISPPPGDLELFLYITKAATDKPSLEVSFRTTIDLWNSNRSAACNGLSEKLSSLGIPPNWIGTLIRLIERSVGHQLRMQPHETLALRMEIISMEPRSAPPAGEDETGGGCWEERTLVRGPKGSKFRVKFHP